MILHCLGKNVVCACSLRGLLEILGHLCLFLQNCCSLVSYVVIQEEFFHGCSEFEGPC